MVSESERANFDLAQLPVVEEWWTVQQAAWITGMSRQHMNTLAKKLKNNRRFGATDTYVGQLVLDPTEVLAKVKGK